jgi:hypothetical protein
MANNSPTKCNLCPIFVIIPLMDHYVFGIHFMHLESINGNIVNFHTILKFKLGHYHFVGFHLRSFSKEYQVGGNSSVFRDV